MIYKVLAEDTKTKSKTAGYREFTTPEFTKSYMAWIKRKTRVHKIPNQLSVVKAINTFFKNVSDAFVESEGGVVLEGIGYLAWYMPMYRRFNTAYLKNYISVRPYFETRYRSYYPYLFTDVFQTNKLKGWSMEETFNKRVWRQYKSNRIHKMLYYKEVKNIYKNKH